MMSCPCRQLITIQTYTTAVTRFSIRSSGSISMRAGVLEHGIEFLQLDSGVLRRETPAHLRLRSVATLLPRFNFVPQHGHFVNPAVEALAGKNAQFRLSHVQPTAVLGSVVELQPLPQSSRLCG